jgi:hypothetical protein
MLFFSTVYRLGLGFTKSPVLAVVGTVFPGVKQPEHDDNHTIPSGAVLRRNETMPPLFHVSF